MKKLILLMLFAFGCFIGTTAFAAYSSQQNIYISSDLASKNYSLGVPTISHYPDSPLPPNVNKRSGTRGKHGYEITVGDKGERSNNAAYILVTILSKDKVPVCYFSTWATILANAGEIPLTTVGWRHDAGQKLPTCSEAGFSISQKKAEYRSVPKDFMIFKKK